MDVAVDEARQQREPLGVDRDRVLRRRDLPARASLADAAVLDEDRDAASGGFSAGGIEQGLGLDGDHAHRAAALRSASSTTTRTILFLQK